MLSPGLGGGGCGSWPCFLGLCSRHDDCNVRRVELTEREASVLSCIGRFVVESMNRLGRRKATWNRLNKGVDISHVRLISIRHVPWVQSMSSPTPSQDTPLDLGLGSDLVRRGVFHAFAGLSRPNAPEPAPPTTNMLVLKNHRKPRVLWKQLQQTPPRESSIQQNRTHVLSQPVHFSSILPDRRSWSDPSIIESAKLFSLHSSDTFPASAGT